LGALIQDEVTILHLEDDPLDAELIRETLVSQGLKPNTFRAETENQFRLELRNMSINLILADYALPGFDGISALRIARELRPDLPFIFVSGTIGEEVAIESLKSGATDYVLKQRLQRLGLSIHRALTGASEHRRRMEADRALRESEERHRLFFERSPLPMWVYDLETLEFLAVNEAAIAHYGYSREEFLAQSIVDIRREPEVERLLEYINQPNPTINAAGVWRHCTKNGTIIEVEITSHRIDYFGRAAEVVLANDVTERMRAEQALRESEERYRELVENAHDIIYEHDLNGNYTSINKAGERITGYSHEETLQLDLAQTIAPEFLEKAHDMLRRKLAGETITAYELETIAKDGHQISLEVNSSLVFQNGVAVGVQGIARDVTKRKQLEEQLRQSQKLEAIGQLAGGVAHDFNNLLTVIGGYSDLLLRKLPADGPLRAHASEIKKAGDRASGLTRQLLAFSRKQILQPKLLDLNGVVSDLDKMLRRLIGEDVDLLTIAGPGLGQVKADPGQIEQVVVNLVVNARDAMTSGGKVTIETANARLTADYVHQHPQCVPGAYVMLAISDNGAGIDSAIRDRIFEPFFSTKGAGKGTGLGLSTVYGIVKQSGGHIWVYSEVNKGTTFKIYLPRVDEGINDETDHTQLTAVPGGNETILLVEDEAQVRQIAQQILESLGYCVMTAENGEQALTLASAYSGEIDLMVTDVVMPQMGGRELVEQLSPLRRNLRVIFMSGYTDDAIVRHGLMDDHLEFIQKPFTADALARKIRTTLDAER
jgi:two-component system cell cycle sensor histidine kinase/response regulator CckA